MCYCGFFETLAFLPKHMYYQLMQETISQATQRLADLLDHAIKNPGSLTYGELELLQINLNTLQANLLPGSNGSMVSEASLRDAHRPGRQVKKSDSKSRI